MGYTQVTGCLGRGDGEEESRRLAGLSEEGASGLQRAEKVQKKKSAAHQGKWALLSLGIWEEKDLDQVPGLPQFLRAQSW